MVAEQTTHTIFQRLMATFVRPKTYEYLDYRQGKPCLICAFYIQE